MSNKVKCILVNGVVTERTLGGTEHKTVWNRGNFCLNGLITTQARKNYVLCSGNAQKEEKKKKKQETEREKPERASLSNRTPNQVGYGLGFRV